MYLIGRQGTTDKADPQESFKCVFSKDKKNLYPFRYHLIRQRATTTDTATIQDLSSVWEIEGGNKGANRITYETNAICVSYKLK